MEALDISFNQIQGTIPSSFGMLGNLTNPPALTGLWVNNNQLSGAVPDSLGSLAALATLDLSNNQLSGTARAAAPASASSPNSAPRRPASSAATSTLRSNPQVPTSLAALPSLRQLRLQNNQLAGWGSGFCAAVPPAQLAACSSAVCNDAAMHGMPPALPPQPPLPPAVNASRQAAMPPPLPAAATIAYWNANLQVGSLRAFKKLSHLNEKSA